MNKEVIEKIKSSDPKSRVYVGCDSSVHKVGNGKFAAKYVTVVILHWGGNNGCKVWYSTLVEPVHGKSGKGLKARLLREADLAIQTAYSLVDHLDGRPMEVHLDLNPDPKHKSSVAVAEALGYARGMGLTAKVKPEAFAATHGADHRT
tara:strand:- start:442 stop:885 length:444 start_codon:yes stop_codon:yes gene_type:complete